LRRVGLVGQVNELLVYVENRFSIGHSDINQIGYKTNQPVHNEKVALLQVIFDLSGERVDNLDKF
jgi:hypothetical protein